MRGNFHGGMGAAGRRATDQKRQIESFAFHFPRPHAPSHRSDGVIRPLNPNGVRLFLAAVSRIFAAGTITPDRQPVIVTLQDNADDVLADVMHVTFDRGHDDGPLCFARALFRFHETALNRRPRFFMTAGALYDLWQKHLSRAE